MTSNLMNNWAVKIEIKAKFSYFTLHSYTKYVLFKIT